MDRRFFFNDTATTEIYTLSLHDALPISDPGERSGAEREREQDREDARRQLGVEEQAAEHDEDERLQGEDGEERDERARERSEEHTSELQSRQYLVCRLLLEKKNSSSCTS